MTDLNADLNPTPGTRGQTKSTWRDEKHLRGLLLRLMQENPDADDEELAELYVAKVEMSDELIREAARRCFDNDLAMARRPSRAAKNATPETGEPQPARAQPQQASATEVTSTKTRLAKLVLLDLVLPNGKKLRDSTGKECRQAGGWLVKVGKQIGDDGIVGEQLDEIAIGKLYASRTR